MHLTIQFPLLDIRRLIYAPILPQWDIEKLNAELPSSEVIHSGAAASKGPKREFVRFFGGIEKSLSQGQVTHHLSSSMPAPESDWLDGGDESSSHPQAIVHLPDRMHAARDIQVYSGSNALRFSNSVARPRTKDPLTSPVRVGFRRLVCDYGLVAAFEIGLEIRGLYSLSYQQTTGLIRHILNREVLVPRPGEKLVPRPLHQVGENIAWLYARAGTPSKFESVVKRNWVQFGLPLLIITPSQDEYIDPPHEENDRYSMSSPNIHFLSHFIYCSSEKKKMLPFWFDGDEGDSDIARILLFLHPIDQALIKLERAIQNGKIVLVRGMKAHEFLVYYLDILDLELKKHNQPMAQQDIKSVRLQLQAVRKLL
ncbi:MAG: hypothetical protein OHK0022_30380 [Roseiflexaceae bacterium]